MSDEEYPLSAVEETKVYDRFEGTPIKFSPYAGSEFSYQNFYKRGAKKFRTKWQSITAMTEYNRKSFEELRFEDYRIGMSSTKGSTSEATGLGYSSDSPEQLKGATTELKSLIGDAENLDSTNQASTTSTSGASMSGDSGAVPSTSDVSFVQQVTTIPNSVHRKADAAFTFRSSGFGTKSTSAFDGASFVFDSAVSTTSSSQTSSEIISPKSTFSFGSSGFGTQTASALDTKSSSGASLSFGSSISTISSSQTRSQTASPKSTFSFTSSTCSDLPSVTRSSPSVKCAPSVKTSTSLSAPTLSTFKFGSSVGTTSSSSTSSTTGSATSLPVLSFTIPATTSLGTGGARAKVPSPHIECTNMNNVHTNILGTTNATATVMSVPRTTDQTYDCSRFGAHVPTVMSSSVRSANRSSTEIGQSLVPTTSSSIPPLLFGSTSSSDQLPVSRESKPTTFSFGAWESQVATASGAQEKNTSITVPLPAFGNSPVSPSNPLAENTSSAETREAGSLANPKTTEDSLLRLESTIKLGFADVKTAVERLTDMLERSMCPRQQTSTDAGKSSFWGSKVEDIKTSEASKQNPKVSLPDNSAFSDSATARTFDDPTELGDTEVHQEEVRGAKGLEECTPSERTLGQDESKLQSVSLADVFELVRALKSADCSVEDMVSLVSLAREMKQSDVTVQDLADMKDYFQKPF